MKRISIGITDGPRYDDFHRWISQIPNVDIEHLSYHYQNSTRAEACDGILLTGGEDIHPKYYQRPEAYLRLEKNYVNEKRDAFELEVINIALQRRKPMLGICRGMQIINIFLGGNMVLDLWEDKGIPGHTRVNGVDQRHGITVSDSSPLRYVCGTRTGVINSSHHQAVDKLGYGLEIGAVATETGVPESIHWADPSGKPWMLLVQWHPERMPDQENPFAGNIRNAFASRCFAERHGTEPQWEIPNNSPEA